MHEAKICAYADDHGIFVNFPPGTDQEVSTMTKLETCLHSVREWMDGNRLKLNASKTEFICFGGSRQMGKCRTNSLNVSGTDIPRSNKIKYLGVWLDQNLSMHYHITQKIKIAMYQLKNIRTISNYLSNDVCKVLVISLVISHLDYCNSLLFGLPDYEISRLQRVQNTAAKLIVGQYTFENSTSALKHLHWLPIRQRIHFKIAVLVFKCIKGLAPTYLSDLLQPKQSREGLRSSNTPASPIFVIPFNKNKTFLDRSFAFSGPFIWNNLPHHVRHSDTLGIFKKHLKTYLFRQAFY